MSLDDWFQERMDTWDRAMRAKGHTPVMENGEISMFAYDVDYHNGPQCDTCRVFWCHHCEGPDAIAECENPCLELTATEVLSLPTREIDR